LLSEPAISGFIDRPRAQASAAAVSRSYGRGADRRVVPVSTYQLEPAPQQRTEEWVMFPGCRGPSLFL
jgi:hypothetical protein